MQQVLGVDIRIVTDFNVSQIESRLRQQSQSYMANSDRPSDGSAERTRNFRAIAVDVYQRRQEDAQQDADNDRQHRFAGAPLRHQRTSLNIRDQRVWSKK